MKVWYINFSGDTWRPFTDVCSPPSYTFRAAVVSLSLGSFELKYLSSHVVVPGQRGGGGEASIRPALFRRPPLWLGERDTRTKLHINRHPPRELLSYTTPTTSHQLPQSLKRGEKKEGRDAGEEELLRLAEISQNPDNQLRHSSRSETRPKTNKVPGLNPTGAKVGTFRCSTSFLSPQRRTWKVGGVLLMCSPASDRIHLTG